MQVSPHTLRQLATYLLEQVDIHVIQVPLGHGKLDDTSLYTRHLGRSTGR
jgi:site-specific recombinase XerD